MEDGVSDARPSQGVPGSVSTGSPKPTRIVFCITELDPGGAERALTQLVLNLNRGDWDPHVICLGRRGYYADVLDAAGIPVICLNARGTVSLPRILFRLTWELRRLRPQIVQTFLFHANIVGRIAAWMSGIRVVVSGLRVAERRCTWHTRIDRWTNGLVTTNVCVSRGVAEFSERVAGLNAKKLVVIPNSVEAELFENARPADLSPWGIVAESRVLISIGRLDRQKGFDVLIEAIALMQPLPVDVHFLIIGAGPEETNLVDQVGRANLTKHVHFGQRRSDVPQLLAASTALILASRWEGMPNVVLEAMAAGLPVIATQVEGISELVQPGVTGLVVGPEQPLELKTAIQAILSDPDFASRAGRASQTIVKKEFTTPATTDAYAKLYSNLVRRQAE